MLILGIESTCDETACALVASGRTILSNVVSSQIDLHKEFGGVVPELACRRHVDVMIPVIDEALIQAGKALSDVDAIAVARGPGLIGALLLGIQTAKTLSLVTRKPLIGVNHIEAHLYAAIMSHEREVTFPALGAVLSGGHTALVLIRDIGHYELIGQTIDDALGEAFDKVAKMLNLPYPGGPQIEQLAKKGDPKKYLLKAGRVKERPFDFSFSGLKTSVLYNVFGQNVTDRRQLTEQEICDVAASFQAAALKDIVDKTLLAAGTYNCKTIIFGGGVTNNMTLRGMFKSGHEYLWPSRGLSLDNAAMIAGLGYHKFHSGEIAGLDLEAATSIAF